RALDDPQVTLALDGHAVDRLSGLGDAVGDDVGPVRLDPDDDHRGDVGVRADADQCAEGQVEVVTELQPAEGVRQRQRAGHERGDAFGRGVRQIVDGQDRDVVAGSDGPVRPAVSGQATLLCHRALLTLWVWT